MKQEFSKVLLSVLGKNIAVKDEHKNVLKEVLSWTVFTMQTDSTKHLFQEEPYRDAVFAAVKSIGLASDGFDKIMIDLLPSSLVQVQSDELNPESKAAVPGIMELYLVHNQNVFTNFRFFKFPFHYWYTAQFLLIMFVSLCLIYAVAIDRMNKKYDFVETT